MMWSLIIIIAIIDLIAVAFYVKTRDRIDYIADHQFTQQL